MPGLAICERPVQLVFAGKAHPDDQQGQRRDAPAVRAEACARRVPARGFFEDYDIPLAGHLVAGCDPWVNVSRPPLEASGTSGMKSVLGGGL